MVINRICIYVLSNESYFCFLIILVFFVRLNNVAGVISVAFKGAKRDQIEIIGDEVDAAGLAKLLRKKLGYADLVSVEEITEKKVNQKENGGDCHHHPHEMELHIYDDPPSRGCTIM